MRSPTGAVLPRAGALQLLRRGGRRGQVGDGARGALARAGSPCRHNPTLHGESDVTCLFWEHFSLSSTLYIWLSNTPHEPAVRASNEALKRRRGRNGM